jgi:hypothetical protein
MLCPQKLHGRKHWPCKGGEQVNRQLLSLSAAAVLIHLHASVCEMRYVSAQQCNNADVLYWSMEARLTAASRVCPRRANGRVISQNEHGEWVVAFKPAVPGFLDVVTVPADVLEVGLEGTSRHETAGAATPTIKQARVHNVYGNLPPSKRELRARGPLEVDGIDLSNLPPPWRVPATLQSGQGFVLMGHTNDGRVQAMRTNEVWHMPHVLLPSPETSVAKVVRGGAKRRFQRGDAGPPPSPFVAADDDQKALHAEVANVSSVNDIRVEGGAGDGKSFVVLHGLSELTYTEAAAGRPTPAIWCVTITLKLVDKMSADLYGPTLSASTRIVPEERCLTLVRLLMLPQDENDPRTKEAKQYARHFFDTYLAKHFDRAASVPPGDAHENLAAVLGAAHTLLMDESSMLECWAVQFVVSLRELTTSLRRGKPPLRLIFSGGLSQLPPPSVGADAYSAPRATSLTDDATLVDLVCSLPVVSSAALFVLRSCRRQMNALLVTAFAQARWMYLGGELLQVIHAAHRRFVHVSESSPSFLHVPRSMAELEGQPGPHGTECFTGYHMSYYSSQQIAAVRYAATPTAHVSHNHHGEVLSGGPTLMHTATDEDDSPFLSSGHIYASRRRVTKVLRLIPGTLHRLSDTAKHVIRMPPGCAKAFSQEVVQIVRIVVCDAEGVPLQAQPVGELTLSDCEDFTMTLRFVARQGRQPEVTLTSKSLTFAQDEYGVQSDDATVARTTRATFQFPFGPAADMPVTHAQGSQSPRTVLHLGRERMYYGQFYVMLTRHAGRLDDLLMTGWMDEETGEMLEPEAIAELIKVHPAAIVDAHRRGYLPLEVFPSQAAYNEHVRAAELKVRRAYNLRRAASTTRHESSHDAAGHAAAERALQAAAWQQRAAAAARASVAGLAVAGAVGGARPASHRAGWPWTIFDSDNDEEPSPVRRAPLALSASVGAPHAPGMEVARRPSSAAGTPSSPPPLTTRAASATFASPLRGGEPSSRTASDVARGDSAATSSATLLSLEDAIGGRIGDLRSELMRTGGVPDTVIELTDLRGVVYSRRLARARPPQLLAAFRRLSSVVAAQVNEHHPATPLESSELRDMLLKAWWIEDGERNRPEY